MNKQICNMWINDFDDFIDNKKTNMIELLINNDVLDVDTLYFKNNNPILLSIYYEFNLSSIKKLIDKGCNINEQNKIGWFPLYMAIEKNNLEYTKLLLENNADINKQYYNECDINDDNNGKSVLHISLNYFNNSKMIKLLLKYNPNVNLLDYKFNIPLNYLINKKYDYQKKNIIYMIIFNLLELKTNIYNKNIDNINSIDIGNKNNINILEIKEDLELLINKKKLSLYKSYNNRLGINSFSKIIPFDLIDNII